MKRARGHDVDERQPSPDGDGRALGVVGQIGLVEQHDGKRATIPDHRQVALEAPHIQVARQRRDQEHGVDVGGDHLFLDGAPGRGARQTAATLKTTMNDAVAHADPIADGREIGGGRVIVTEPAADFGGAFGVAGHLIQPPLFFDDSRKSQVGSPERRYLRCKKRIPPQTFT